MDKADKHKKLIRGKTKELRQVIKTTSGLDVDIWASASIAKMFDKLGLRGAVDQMTTPKAAQGLIQLAQAAGKQHRVVKIPVGHNQMTEAPEATLFALRDFLAERS